jgi:hypothetical protein
MSLDGFQAHRHRPFHTLSLSPLWQQTQNEIEADQNGGTLQSPRSLGEICCLRAQANDLVPVLQL